MPWGYAAAAVAGSLVSGAISSDASQSAANKQSDAAQRATDEQKREYDLYREDQAPYREKGYAALGKLGELLGLSGDPNSQQYGSLLDKFTGADLANDPGYQFRLKQGQDALENSAAARGGLFSGAAGKALNEYGQGFASNEFQNAWQRDKAEKDTLFNRNASLAGLGQTATQSVGQAGEHYADAYGNNQIGAANAQAAAGLGSANAWSNAVNQGFAAYGRGGNGGGQYTSPNFFTGAYSNPPGDTYDYSSGNLFGSAGDYSDPDLKEDVIHVLTREDGLNVYEFRYVWEGKRRLGLMADEVERLYPEAVSRDALGLRKVDYSKVP